MSIFIPDPFSESGIIQNNVVNLLDSGDGFNATDYEMLPHGYNTLDSGNAFLWYSWDQSSFDVLWNSGITDSDAACFYWMGHGGPDLICPGHYGEQGQILVSDVVQYFDNHGASGITRPWTLVILDACNTYSKAWSDAWGIPDFAERTKADYSKYGLDPNAFVGWTGDTDETENSDGANAYGFCLFVLFTDWQNGVPLKECLDDYNIAISFSQVSASRSFSLNFFDTWKISGCLDLTTDDR